MFFGALLSRLFFPLDSRYGAPLSASNFYATPLNHRLGITSVWFRATGATNWIWTPRDEVNRFRFGGPGNVYGSNSNLQFDIRISSVATIADLICTGIVWAPSATTRPGGAPTNSNWAVQSLGTCQFADPGVAATTCGLLYPPNVIEDQFYGYSACGSNTCDSSPKNKVVLI